MWISALLHWLVVSPGLHERPDFPLGLFFARFIFLFPLTAGLGRTLWPSVQDSVVISLALCAATIINFFTLTIQAFIYDSR